MGRKAALPVVILIALITAAAAQQNGSMTPQEKSRAIENTRSGPITLTGCLQSDRGVSTLLGQDTAFILVADPAELARNTGHQVRVVGSELPPNGNRAPHDLPRVQVQRFEVLGGDCAINLSRPAPGVSGSPSPQQGTVQENSPYREPGSMATTPAPVGPGTGWQVNGRTEGAPSPGSGDPRNLSPSPQDVPVNPPQAHTGNKPDTKRDKDEEKNPPGLI